MAASSFKIGQIASRTGISVRTLRHYDAIGLLSPAYHTQARHRLYTDREVSRLHKIVALRRMGFSLEHVRAILSGDTRKAYAILEAQAHRLRGHIALQQDILSRVEAFLGVGKTRARLPNNQEIEVTKKRAAELREALILEMDRGTDPKDPCVQNLVGQLETLWMSVFRTRNRPKTFDILLRSWSTAPVEFSPETVQELRMSRYIHRARSQEGRSLMSRSSGVAALLYAWSSVKKRAGEAV